MTATALVVDSSALLTDRQIEDLRALVVPITVTVDGTDYLEGVDLSPDRFYQLLTQRHDVEVGTAQPSPAQFLQAFDQAARAGASSVLAILVGSAFSGTLDSANVAAARAPIPVSCVDTGQASFGIGLCALAAGAALEEGATANEAVEVVVELAPRIESVFIIQALELARASGRFDSTLVVEPDSETPLIPVLHFRGGELTVAGEVGSLDDAVEVMAAVVAAGGDRLRVASGLADPATRPVTEALEARLDQLPAVGELLRYRVGPSVAANTGPGTAGVFFHRL